MGKTTGNKKAVRYILIVLILVIAAGAAVLLTVGRSDGNDTGDRKQESGVAAMQPLVIDTSEAYAKKLYACKVEDVDDTAAVVTLLETMGMESVTGKYTATISPEEKIQVLTLTAEEPVKKTDKKVFDANMELCSQQLLALIPSVDKVQWVCSVSSGSAEEESSTVSLDSAGATKQLPEDVKSYGGSAGDFQKLLMIQAGEDQ